MTISPGTVLIKEDMQLPASVKVSRKAGWNGWVAIHSLDPRGLGKQLRDVGWDFHLVEGTLSKSAFGFDAGTRFDRALGSVLKHALNRNCNCVEFDQMAESSILGVPCTSVSVRSRFLGKDL